VALPAAFPENGTLHADTRCTPSQRNDVMNKALSIATLLVFAMTGTALAHDEDFDLSINAPAAKAKAKGVAKIKIEPKGKVHMNLEYPTKLTIAAPSGVTVEKGKQTSKDAIKFDKNSAEFEVAFTADSPGQKSFTGELKFAVCEEQTSCHPHSEKLSFKVDVK
jgi:hypothetical protein